MGYSGVLLKILLPIAALSWSPWLPSLLSQSHSKLRQPSTPLLPAPSRPHRLSKVNGVDDFTLGWVMLGHCLSRDTLDTYNDNTEVRRISISLNFITTAFQHITTTRHGEDSTCGIGISAVLCSCTHRLLDSFLRWEEVMRSWSRMSRMSRAAVHIPSSFTTSQKQLNELDEVSISSFSIVSLNRIMGARWCQHGIEQYILFLCLSKYFLLAVASARTASPHILNGVGLANLIYWIILDLLLNWPRTTTPTCDFLSSRSCWPANCSLPLGFLQNQAKYIQILTGTFFATCKVGDTPNSDFTQHLVSAAPPEEMPWLLPLPCREEKTIECDTAIPAQGGLLYLAWWLSQNWQHRKHKLQCLGLIMKNVVAMSRGTIRGLQTSSRKTWFALYCSSKSSNREATSDTPSLWSFGWYIWLMISQYCTRFTHWLLLAFHLHKHLEHPIHINPWWPGRNTEHMPRSIPCDPPWLPSWMSCPARTNVEEHLAISDIKHTMKGMMTQFPSTIFHDFHSILPRKFALLRL